MCAMQKLSENPDKGRSYGKRATGFLQGVPLFASFLIAVWVIAFAITGCSDEGSEAITLGKIEDGEDYAEVSVEDLNENSEKYHTKKIRIELEVGAGDPWIEETTGTASKFIRFRASDEGAFGIGDTVISSALIPKAPDQTIFNDVAKSNLRPGERIKVSGSLISGELLRRGISDYRKDLASKGIDYRDHEPEGGFPVIHDFQIIADQIVVYRKEDQKQITTDPDDSPSDQTVHSAASSEEDSILDALKRGAVLFSDDENPRSGRVGDLMTSTGGLYGPEGTVVVPVKYEGGLVCYFMQDEFDDWYYSFEGTRNRLPLPTMEEILEQKQDRKRKEAEELATMRLENDLRDKAIEANREVNEKKELERQAALEEMRKKSEQERKTAKIEEERARLEHIRRTEEIRDETMESLRVAGERQRLENDLRDEAIKAGKDTATVPTKKEIPTKTGDTPTQDKPIGLAEAKAQLAALDTQIASEQKRWADATFIVNKLTNFRKSPVEKNSPAHHQSYAALKIIQEVEQKAPAMKADKVRLETLIEELSRE